MKNATRRLVAAPMRSCLAIAVSYVALSCCAFPQALRKFASIDLPGPAGQRFDYLTIDEEDHYVLSAHLGPGLLYLVDTKTNQVVKVISGLPGITGLEYVSGFHKVYTSNWGEEKIGVIDLRTMSVIKRLPTESKPNGIAYAEPFRKIYVVNTLGKAVSVVDVNTDEIVKVLRFNSETGTPGYDAVAKKIYVTLRSTNEVAEIDPSTDRVIGQYSVEGCTFNHGMAVDAEHHRAFLLCSGTRNLTIFALDSHKTVAHFPIPAGADVVKFDSGLGRVYAACSSGAISIVQEDSPDLFRKIEDFPVQKLVHSLAVDPATHRVYAPEQEEDGRPVARMIVYEPAKK
jgi:YVTN family beta-propeller protein